MSIMEKIAVPTGDVVKDWDIREDEKIYFLLRSGENTFTMGLGDLLECLRFAEKEGEVPKLPAEWWRKMWSIYPQIKELVEVPEDNEEI